MPPKKSATETQPTAPKTPGARKKRTPTETQPAEPAPQPLALEVHPTAVHPTPRWFTPVAIGLAVAVLLGILLEINPPLGLASAGDRLSRLEAMVNSSGAGGTALQARLASAEKVARLCREGLQSMVRMWNRYVQELKASEASPARFRAARRRFDTAQKQASLAVSRCEDA
jgi:hypothetical protein